MENQAYIFAKSAHKKQTYGGLDYTDSHLRAVVQVLLDFGFSGEWGDAGWLHDTVEDTNATIAEIRDTFGERVADLVWAVSGFGENRKARNADIKSKIAEYPDAAIIKVADRIANAENAKIYAANLFRMYERENDAFIEMVGDHVPSQMLDRLKSIFQ